MEGEQPKKGTEFVCEVCGTTLVVTEEGVGLLENMICCERPMESRRIKHKHKPKKAAAKPKKRKKSKR
jgi:hypothetical protein